MQLYYEDEVDLEYIFDHIVDKYNTMIAAKKKDLQQRKRRLRR